MLYLALAALPSPRREDGGWGERDSERERGREREGERERGREREGEREGGREGEMRTQNKIESVEEVVHPTHRSVAQLNTSTTKGKYSMRCDV
jgi:hypothetical protein